MPTLTFQVTSVCSGGNHYTLQIGGDLTATKIIEREDLTIERGEREALAMDILRLRLRGMTPAQIRTALQAGVTVTL